MSESHHQRGTDTSSENSTKFSRTIFSKGLLLKKKHHGSPINVELIYLKMNKLTIINAASFKDKDANKIFPMSVKQTNELFLEDKPYFSAFIKVYSTIQIL